MRNDVFTNVTNILHFNQIFTPDWMNQLSAICDSVSQFQFFTPNLIDQLSAVCDSVSQFQIFTPALMDQLSAVCDSISQFQIFTPDWMNQLSAIYDSMPAAVEIPTIEFPFDSLNFLKDIDFQQDYIDLTENDCDSINAILRPSDASEDAPLKVSKGKMAVSDFIKTILFPLFLALLQMMHTSYYNKLEAIDSQKVYMEEHQLKEEEIQLLKKQIQLQQQEIQNISDYATSLENTLNELIGYVSSQEYLQDTLESDSVLPNSSVLPDEDPESLDEVPHCSPEVPNCFDTTADESDNP